MKAENFVLEIGTEELPPSFIEPALSFLKSSIKELLRQEQISFESISTAGTPRRLIVLGRGVLESSPLRKKLIIGPSKKVAFDSEGNPTKAAIGFASSKGARLEELITVKTSKGEYVAVEQKVGGQLTGNVLASKLPEIISKVPFKKSMRWADKEVRFARPIRWIVFVFGREVFTFELDGIKSSQFSQGHRFLAPEPFFVDNPAEFLSELEERFVIADIKKRRNLILEESSQLAKSIGGKLLKDDGLLEEVTNLVEFPYPMLGWFDEEFLQLPKEVPITVLKEHQRFFSITDKNGNLKNAFVAVSNIKPADESVVRRGYEKVVRARLKDALFFFNEDRKKKLSDRVPLLKGVIFHQKLGNMLEKTERLIYVSSILAQMLKADGKKAKRAAFLSKADLLTEMVNEFPELQGIMGMYYAKHDGEDEEVSKAIFEQYLPRFQDDVLPSSKSGISLSIADKIDNLIGFFAIGLKPTGSEDPFALRRAALGIVQIILNNRLELPLKEALRASYRIYTDQDRKLKEDVIEEVLTFIKERLKNFLADKGYKKDSIEACLNTTDNLREIYERVKTLEKLRLEPEFSSVILTFKRVSNILPKGFTPKSEKLSDLNPYEDKLFKAYNEAKSKIEAALKDRNYEEAFKAISELKPVVDEFFDNVLVMDKNPEIRQKRLTLLYLISSLIREVAEINKLS